MARMLSTHFTLTEFTDSQTAARQGIPNVPNARQLRNLEALAATLEVVRKALGNKPVRVSSGFRSPALNAAIGGSTTSAHLEGLGVDFTAAGFGTVLQTAKAVAASGIEFDQIIYEYGAWVHLGIGRTAPGAPARRELLSISKTSGGYVSGLRVV
jgi:zinc D-Ala-D-Ala carboxypeptidase